MTDGEWIAKWARRLLTWGCLIMVLGVGGCLALGGYATMQTQAALEQAQGEIP